jgi:hypothetical protein
VFVPGVVVFSDHGGCNDVWRVHFGFFVNSGCQAANSAPLPVAYKTALAGFDHGLARDRLYVRRWRQSPCILK